MQNALRTVRNIVVKAITRINTSESEPTRCRPPSETPAAARKIQGPFTSVAPVPHLKLRCQPVQKGLLLSQHSRVPLAKAHLEQWVQRAGKEEICSRGLVLRLPSSHEPLTVEDYLQEEEPEKLKKK